MNYGLIEVVAKGTNWITLPLLALVTTANLYGELAYYYLVIVLTGTFLAFGQNRVILSSEKENIETKKNISILISFILLFFVELFLFFLGYFELKIFIAILCGCFFAIQNNLSLTFRAQNRIDSFIKIKTYYLFRIVGVFIIVYFTKSIELYLLSELAILILYFIFFSKFRFYNKNLDILNSLKDGFILVMYAISMYLITNLDKFYIEHIFTKDVLASYYFLFSLSTSFTFISAYFSVKYEREIYSSLNYYSAKSHANNCTYKTILYSVLLFPFVFLLYYFYVKFTALEYKPYWFIMVFIAQLIYFLSIKETYMLTFLKKNKIIFYSSFLILFISLISNYFLINLLGILGCILTLILCYTIFWLVMNFYNFRYQSLDK
ncbi:lipopolysaccharide biosynthesis protein [Acinetobacter baumannii]|uniref:lipopolysaccharide biosynthesis protein n=1 Tax=Acinetobacter baumannii TaxID=470 RepID=UPI00112B5751|nr:hypothetical protein [Acinetobacter baumannii]TPV04216.1 hypothetical protein FJV22_14690 [Acinetobacter baumannii]